MSVFPKYPSILNLDKRPEIFMVKEVVATEKLHGSTFRLHFPAGMASVEDVLYGSHDTVYGDTEKFPLNGMRLWFMARPELLTAIWDVIKSYGYSDATIFGEAYGAGTGTGVRMKGIQYGVDASFRAFGIMVGEGFLTYDLFVEVIEKMGVPRVHEVWRGEPTQENLDALLEKPSHEGRLNGITDENNIAEGIVVQSNPLFRTSYGEWLIAKHKAKKFIEKAHPPAEIKEKGLTPADVFAMTYVTEGRVTNAIGRLHDRGVPLKHDMTDMMTMIAEIIADLHKECEPEWLALEQPEATLKGAVSRVLGPIYRKIVTEE